MAHRSTELFQELVAARYYVCYSPASELSQLYVEHTGPNVIRRPTITPSTVTTTTPARPSILKYIVITHVHHAVSPAEKSVQCALQKACASLC